MTRVEESGGLRPADPVDARRFADKLFDATVLAMALEGELTEMHLDRIFGEDKWGAEPCSFDYYDYSLELHGCPPDFRATPEQVAEIWRLGFARMWINHTDSTETSYRSDGPPEGHHHASAPFRNQPLAAGAPDSPPSTTKGG